MNNNYTFLGTFVKIKNKYETVDIKEYKCPNHPKDYTNEIMKYCSKCGEKIVNSIVKQQQQVNIYGKVVEDKTLLDTVYLLCSTENDEEIWASNLSKGVIKFNNIISIKDLPILDKIAEFKLFHREFLKFLDLNEFNYTIDFGVVEYTM